MAGRDRIAAVKRARERQARVEAAVARVAAAERRVDRSKTRRQSLLEAADAKVANAELMHAHEVDALVRACGSIGYAAEVLGTDERHVRRVVRCALRDSSGGKAEGGHSANGRQPPSPATAIDNTEADAT